MITTTRACAVQQSGTWENTGQPATGSGQNLRDFRLADWLVQPSLDRLTGDGVVVRIRPQLMDLLVCLAARAGATVTRDDLFTIVWSGRFVAESSVSRCVAELRQALGDSARHPRIIETIHKRGYRLIAPVVWTPARSPALQRADTSTSGKRSTAADVGFAAVREVTEACVALRPSHIRRAMSRLRAGAITLGARFGIRRQAE